MKVSDPTSVRRTQKIGAARGAAPSAGETAPVAPSDKVTLLGIPENELTPNVRTALISLIEDIRTLRGELDQARKRIGDLETLADRDPMLDVLNRRAFARELDRTLSMIERYQFRASLLIIDLNDLKIINDQRGHAAGDAALEHVARILTSNVRQTDVVARLGGDEFAVLLLQADDAIAASKAQAIQALVAETPVAFEGGDFQAGISWGAVEIRQGVSAQEAMNRADEAMYEAKKLK